MPSEAQSQEPRDRGPPPPITRAGRSAQLAKAADSPTPKRRPRGRPRKDGSSGCPAPPTTTPPPPPSPKSRKKGRSRGRAQVEDEESTDATEKTLCPKTEVKTGRRQSTSRRKSNTSPKPNPEPSLNRLSLEPEPDPDLSSPVPHPPVPESSPEPTPSTEEENSGNPAPDACLLASSSRPVSSPRESPEVSPSSTAPFIVHSPTPRPGTDCVDDYHLRHSSACAEEDSVSIRVPMDTESGGACPMEQSPTMSPRSSPPVSPCLGLEDDDSLSPLFHRSLSEDSGGSPTPSLGHTKKCLKQCAFCYCGEEPPLGQGRLVVFGPTPGYIPLHVLNRRASSDRDNDCHDHCYRGDRATSLCSSPEQSEDESSLEFLKQLGPIGLPHDIDVQSLFDPTGQCSAHLQCAAWSEGVCRGEGQSLLFVDKAIDSGSTQVCVFCRRLGASLRCQETGCGRSYHFPCAAAAGAHQDWAQRHTLCSRHTPTGSCQCVVCSGGSEVSGSLMCCCCGKHYHGSCLDPPLNPSPMCRVGWQCPQCRVCQGCRMRGDEGMLLVCKECDKAYHTHCLTPPLDHTPSTSWSCKNCRICRRCGVRSAGQWANHPFLCVSCDQALPCPLCGYAPSLYTAQEYLTCISCYRCVHADCVVQAGEGRAGTEGYICSICRPQEEELPCSPTPATLLVHTEAPPISPAAHSPAQFGSSESPQSPIKTICAPSPHSLTPSYPGPAVLQQSPAPSSPCSAKQLECPSPSHPGPTNIQQSTTQPSSTEFKESPPHPGPTEIQESPPHPGPIEIQESPPHPEPAEIQESPPHPDPTGFQESPPHPDPTEIQESPPHPDSTEFQESPPYTDPIEIQESPRHLDPTKVHGIPDQPDLTVIQDSPSHPAPTEIQDTSSPPHPAPTEIQDTSSPPHPAPTEIQDTSSPPHPAPTEIQDTSSPPHPAPTEIQDTSSPPHPAPTEIQDTSSPPHPAPTEIQDTSSPSHPAPTEIQDTSSPPHPAPTEIQDTSSPPHPAPTEIQDSSSPSHPGPTEIQDSSSPPHPEPTEIQDSPPHPGATEIKDSPPHPGPTEIQDSSTPHSPCPTEQQECLSPTPPELTKIQKSPAPSSPCPALQEEWSSPGHSDPSEIQLTSTASDCYQNNLQQCLLPSHLCPTQIDSPNNLAHFPAEQKEGNSLSNHDSSENHERNIPSLPSLVSPVSPQQDPTQCQPPLHSPAELHQSHTPLTSKQSQQNQPSVTSSSPTQNSTQDECLMSCVLEHSQHSPLSHILTQPVHSPTRVLTAEPHCSPAHDNSTTTQLNRSCSPANIFISQPHSPPQREHSPTPESLVDTFPPQNSTQDAEPTLDQESPGSSSPSHQGYLAVQDISTLEQGHSSVYSRSTRTANIHASVRPVSAPNSPSPSSLRPRPCCLSQPASPVKVPSTQVVRPLQIAPLPFQLAAQSTPTKECIQTTLEKSPTQQSPNLDGLTPKSSPFPLSPSSDPHTLPRENSPDERLPNELESFQSSTLTPDLCRPPQASLTQTPESLVHVNTSLEHSSLICSPCADEMEESSPTVSYIHHSPCEISSHCTDAIAKASPKHIQASSASASPTHCGEMPKSPPTSLQASKCSSMPMENSPVDAEISPTAQSACTVTQTGSCSLQPVSPSAPPLVESPSPSPVLISSQNEEMDAAGNHQARNSPSHPVSPVHTSSAYPSPVHTDVHSGPQERTSSSVCGFAELAYTETSPSPSHVQTTCTPSQTAPVRTSPLPTPASFSPPHCTQTDTSPASSAVSHSLSYVTSDRSGQGSACSASVNDANVIHNPPRSSPAGQASPVYTIVAHSETKTPSLASAAYDSQVHATVIHVSPPHSPPHSPPQAIEAFHHTHCCPTLDTGTTAGLTGGQLSPTLTSSVLDVDVVASPIVQNSVLPGVAQLDIGLVKPSDHSRQNSPTPANPVPDDPISPSLSQTSESPASPHVILVRSTVERSQQSTASVGPSYQRPHTPVYSTEASTSHVHTSPTHSPTQDNTVLPSSSHTSETTASLTCSDPAQISPPLTVSCHDPKAQSSSAYCGPKDLGFTKTAPSPGPSSPVQPEHRPSPGPTTPSSGPASHVQPAPLSSPGSISPMHCEVNPSCDPVLCVSANLGQSETCPVQPGAGSGLGSPSDVSEQETKTESESADINMAEGEVEQRKTEQQLEGGESPKEESVSTEGVGDQDEDCRSKPLASEVQLSPSHAAAASPPLSQLDALSPWPVMPQSTLSLPQPSLSPSSSLPASPLPLPQSPPYFSPRAGSLEASPFSSPHRTASHTFSPQNLCPSIEDCPQEDKPTSQTEEIGGNMGLEHNSQSQSLFKPVAVATEPTKEERHSPAEPLENEEEPETSEAVTPLQINEEEDGEVHREQSDVDVEEDPVSPVLDLDPSLDMEVMELMTSSPPPSLLHLSSPSPPLTFSRRGKTRTLRPPPSSRPLDDLSIRLRQSPFSTEASPETSPVRAPVTPPELSPTSPPLRCSPFARESPPISKHLAPPPTVLSFTPKIGMGKPAISKRKFSPGRTRVKQGSWWSNRRAVSPPSSSQDSTGEGGWDSPMPRPPDSPLWSMKVGRGSGFPSRRRSRGGGVGGGRGGRGRSRIKTQDSPTVSPGCGYVEPFQSKDEEENSMHNTVVMFSTSDHFTLKQDMCVVCGSFGQGAEGRLLACSQCGQCYHPYCVNVKITRVILTKGWRCLECTVCEACGEASDPGRLLLCDDCDISYHTYCLDPPLHTVPKGAWKCKWCVWCVQCGSTSPGMHCDWQSNYSLCGPCGSLRGCPLCQRAYTQDDLIIQCHQCDRWVHALCQGLSTEDEVEAAADEGFDCSLCRTHSSSGRTDSLGPYRAQIVPRIRDPDTKTYTQDGVCLTESGLSHLQSLVEPLTSPRRYRRCKPKLKLRIINQNSVSVLQTPPDPDPPSEQDHTRGDGEYNIKSDSSPERDHLHGDDATKEPEVTDGKKRKRKPYRPGIGGFMVRQRGGKAGPNRIKLCRKDSTETLLGREEGMLETEVAMELAPAADQAMEKVKKRYRKKKTKLEEAFPSYLQEAFFGRDLLDRTRQVDRKVGPEMAADRQSGATTGDLRVAAPGPHGPSQAGLPVCTMRTSTMKKQRALPMSEEALVDLSDVLNIDPHILATAPSGQFHVERSPSPFAGLDISSMADDPSFNSKLTESGGRGQKVEPEEPLDVILSPELDKMVSDGAILSKLYKIPELEGKDVEEVFTAVLSPSSSSRQPEQDQHTHSSAAMFPRMPLMNGPMPAASHFTHTPVMPGGPQGSAAGFRASSYEGPPTAPVQGHAPSLVSASQTSAAEGEQDALSTAQRSMLKWEKEESLGELATVAPVLYCNTNFPQLRQQYPDWSTRVKQIAKLWRKASSQDRAPYVQKARDNRAAQRISKVQLSNDPLKRQPPSQPQQQPPLSGPYDPVSMEADMAFKDPLRTRESEQEQEWKLRQQMRQKSKQLAKMEATQKLEQVKNEQRQLLANQRTSDSLSPETGCRSPLTPGHQPVTGGSASPVHPSRDGQSRQHLLLTGGSGPTDDVFLRPQAPPPSGFPSLPHSPHSSSPLHQPPSSPQMFSPPSSRPSSPWDPYSKMAGTPRPTSSQSGAPSAPQQQQRTSLSASPAHDSTGSPLSPDSKASDISRNPGVQSGLQQSKVGMMSPPSGSAIGIRAPETYQRNNVRIASESYSRAGELVQGNVFKAPMPPQQEVFGSTGGGRRDPSRPTDLGLGLPLSQEPLFPSSPLSGLGSPHRSPYSQTPGTPRPDYSQQIADTFAQQSPLTSRPSPDPYTNPQTPGTPRSHSDPTYLSTPPTLRLDHCNQRPSPSHPALDPYASNPGTPHPSVTERFPRSPGSQWNTDPYTQSAGTPRPSPELFAQQPSTPRPQKTHEPFTQAPVESSPSHPAGSGSSPMASGLIAEPSAFTAAAHQSPGQQHQQQQQHDSLLRTPSSQTPKHFGMTDDGSSSLASQTPGHDLFEQVPMTACQPQTDKTAANEMSVLGVASGDGPMSMLPQLGDSEEKLRQRQRLRQLILRQQQQKSALRQEKGLQEPAVPQAARPTPASATSLHSWSQEDSSTAPPTDPFGRPPPPYPGTVPGGTGAPRFPGGFSVEQQRAFRELGVRGPAMRFAVPPGAPAALQESFLRPPQGSMPPSGLSVGEGVPVQMRRPMSGEFTGIRQLAAANAQPHMVPGVPQAFLPRSLPMQQHNIMGQPYIELRHRAPENRLRLPFPMSTVQEPEAPHLFPRDPQPSGVRPGPGTRMGEAEIGQQMVIAGSIEQPNASDQQHIGHSGSDSALPGADGMEENLEGEDSAVKDLEDVEVKDLVDLNLNLDPEDGKEDLDLGPNDLHLDDILLSGKFDLIAYADPELNLEDKKDMFNEELDLGEPVEESGRGERRDAAGSSRKADTHLIGQVKQEMKDSSKTESVNGSSAPQHPAGPERATSVLLNKKLEDSCSVSGALPAIQTQDQAPLSGMAPRVHAHMSAVQQSVFQQEQRPCGPPPSSSAPLTTHPQSLPVSPSAPSHPLSAQPPQPRLLLNTQTQPPTPTAPAQSQTAFSLAQTQNQNKSRPLLLEEQPLLLQDLLDQERQEQQQQKQMQAMIRQRSNPESVFPNMADFDSISDPIMKAKMVALKGINKVMTQGNLGMNPMVINRFQPAPAALSTEPTSQPSAPVGQDGKLNPQLVRPSPPSCGSGFVNEAQRRQYEEWLGETQQLLQMQQRLLEDQIAAHRKTKKALSAKQRTAKKAGRAFAEEDAAQLRYITEQQGTVQKQLEQIRKQQKDHTELIEDYRTKQQQRALQQPPPPPPVISQSPLPQPMVPLQSHLGGPPKACASNVPPGWTPGSAAAGGMGQRMPQHPSPQIPPTLNNATQTSIAMVPGHTATTVGFTADPRGLSGGPDGAASAPQVKFDDNNPFSEGFQERERRERLREQQERQRVQLMQEVERHRSLQQRLELEQQGLLGGSGGLRPEAAVTGVSQTPRPGPAGSAPAPTGDSLSQMPFFSSELPTDFLQSPQTARVPAQHQTGPPFPQAGLHQGFTGGPLRPGAHSIPGLLPRAPMDMAPSNLQARPRLQGQVMPPSQGQGHPACIGGAGMNSSYPGGQSHRFHSSSSSPSTPLPASFPGSTSGGPASLIQLYSDIIPNDTLKKRSRKRDGEDTTGGGPRTPLSSHSDDMTGPPTPAISDTSCSTPTRGSTDHSDTSLALCGLAPSSELERQLAVRAQQRAPVLGMDNQRGTSSAAHLDVKVEREERRACGGSVVKMEECGGDVFSSPSSPHGGDGGKELLRHLLKDKSSPATTPSPTGLIPPAACRQLSNDSMRSEEEDGPGFHGKMVAQDGPGLDLLEPSSKKKAQRCKRQTRPDQDKAPPKYKRRKREEEEKMLHSSSDPLTTHLRQLSVLPLMEPILGVDLSLFPPYGSSSLGRDSRLSGSFGNASLDGVTDYYSQLIYKQNNLSNPPTPPASLPPTPPPVARQKLVNGFATTEELSRKDLSEPDVKGVSALKQKGEELMSLNTNSKTVDVPASLPTPPHNNQEELRVQDLSERNSPDGFIPSSSPESVSDMEVSRYPDLSFIKLEPPSPCPSPTLPMMPCAWGKGSAVKQEVKAEPNHQGHPSCSNTDLVTIAITLNPVIAQNVAGVMATVAQLLQVPIKYQLSRPAGPEQSSLALLAGVRVPLTPVSAGVRQQRPPAAAGLTGVRMEHVQHGSTAQPSSCCYCKVLLGSGVHIVKELKQDGSSLVFCSTNCCALYTSDLQGRSATNKPPASVLLSGSECPPSIGVHHQYTNNMSSITVHSLPRTPSSTSSSPPLTFPSASVVTMETRHRMDCLKVKVKLKPHPRAMPGGDDLLSPRHGKRIKSSRWRRWSFSITLNRGPCTPNEAVTMPTEEEMDLLLKKLGGYLRPDPLPKDQRRCCFCHQLGDGQTDGPARLLNLDLDLWVHLNCALWSSEVYETQAGALINVELALRRGLTLRCAHCQQTGATSGCNRLRCTNTYHFTCALHAHCTFFKDKTMLCSFHKPRTVSLSGDRLSSGSPSSTPGLTQDPTALMVASDPYDSELRCFAVFRRVFVQRDEARQIAAVVQRGERQHTFRVGSLLFRAVGRLLPHQMNAFHNQTAIFPVGYHANRIYWSMRHSNRRCKYMCYIEEADGRPLFKVKVVEKGHDDLILTGQTPKAVWDQILEPVSQMRASSGTLKLFPVYLKGEDLFGLTTSAVTRIVESLPGVEACERYTFRFGRNPLMEWPLAFNPSGSARSEPKAYQAKRPYLLTSIATRCQGSVGSIVGLVPGVISLSPGESIAGAHQGRHSKSSQYRRMKAEWKTNVYLARSRIQGLGLYAARDIEKCTMVIEYIGTIIRSEVANRKERLYESQNRGVYMFRIDNDYVIDATITGGPARYINHSCAPNCITEVVTVEKENKIIISSCRRIQRGEELSYDYKFDLEDDQHKIPCHCGAVNCRKWMN
ncbi:histone-lysine N-methyltransferase 2C-like isoform X3 [Parambassis ranga]|uniref:Histone-lysine N-methyltransferase 2C n=1 Tax=Parambassis ranga TaxID=210632 RepID=A0A6P7KFJ8_9TELE|nr:histone-lysine N-methyltransferase 2C-like isoform X3 [Parambassis ranga]